MCTIMTQWQTWENMHWLRYSYDTIICRLVCVVQFTLISKQLERELNYHTVLGIEMYCIGNRDETLICNWQRKQGCKKSKVSTLQISVPPDVLPFLDLAPLSYGRCLMDHGREINFVRLLSSCNTMSSIVLHNTIYCTVSPLCSFYPTFFLFSF